MVKFLGDSLYRRLQRTIFYNKRCNRNMQQLNHLIDVASDMLSDPGDCTCERCRRKFYVIQSEIHTERLKFLQDGISWDKLPNMYSWEYLEDHTIQDGSLKAFFSSRTIRRRTRKFPKVRELMRRYVLNAYSVPTD